MLGASTGPPGRDRVRALLADRRVTGRADLGSYVLRAIADGELSGDTDPGALAAVFESFCGACRPEP